MQRVVADMIAEIPARRRAPADAAITGGKQRPHRWPALASQGLINDFDVKVIFVPVVVHLLQTGITPSRSARIASSNSRKSSGNGNGAFHSMALPLPR